MMKEKKNSMDSKGEKSSNKSKSSTASIEETRKQNVKKKKEKESEKMKYGRRMFDDDINTFLENIQQAAGTERAFEGLCAIQLFSVNEPVRNRKVLWKRRRCCCWGDKMKGEPRMGTPFFPGKKVSCQVLLDQRREHFVLITYDPKKKFVNLYDSLYKPEREVLKHFPKTICYQICSAYGHLAEDGKLQVRLQQDFESQDDEWSCGYRCVGAVLAMYQGKDPEDISYDLPAIYDFFMKVITRDSNGNYLKLSWKDIVNINIGSVLERDETFYSPRVILVNEVNYGIVKKNGKESEEKEEDEEPTPPTDATATPNRKSTTSSQTGDENWKNNGRLRSGKEREEKKEQEDPYHSFPLRYITRFASNFLK